MSTRLMQLRFAAVLVSWGITSELTGSAILLGIPIAVRRYSETLRAMTYRELLGSKHSNITRREVENKCCIGSSNRKRCCSVPLVRFRYLASLRKSIVRCLVAFKPLVLAHHSVELGLGLQRRCLLSVVTVEHQIMRT